jgi:hypothetical protein
LTGVEVAVIDIDTHFEPGREWLAETMHCSADDAFA